MYDFDGGFLLSGGGVELESRARIDRKSQDSYRFFSVSNSTQYFVQIEYAAKKFEESESEDIDGSTLREISVLRFLSQVRHPNIIPCVDVSQIEVRRIEKSGAARKADFNRDNGTARLTL